VETPEERIARLYQGLNRRSLVDIESLCHPEIELDLVTGHLSGRDGPYRGYAGLRDYIEDVERIWDELLVTPRHIAIRDGGLVVFGRVYGRSRTLGIRDLPTIWLWEQRDSRFLRGSIITDQPQKLKALRLPS